MRIIEDFIRKFDSNLSFDKNLIIQKKNRFFLLSKVMKKYTSSNFFYCGLYLGTKKGKSFFPSFLLLSMIAKNAMNKIIVDKKTAWLFICGRDVFKKGIINGKNFRKGDYSLVLNERNECLGFGEMLINLYAEIDLNKVALKNILDIGDFLRRERN